MAYQVYRDPVLATNGHAYERAWMTRWLEMHSTSHIPMGELNVKKWYLMLPFDQC